MDGVVLSQVTVVPPHRGDAAAAVLLHQGVLWFARGWEPNDRGNNGRLILFFFLLFALGMIRELRSAHPMPPCSRSLQSCHS